MTQTSASLPVTASPTAPPTAGVCPYLLASDGRWRAATAAREHRCTAVAPATVITLDKQRRLCLAAAHGTCVTFQAAGSSIDDEARPTDRPSRAVQTVPRTAPLVLDHGRRAMPPGGLAAERGVAQVALLLLMVVAFAAILVARLSGPGPDGGVLAGAGGPGASSMATDGATSVPSTAPTADATPVPTSAGPSATASGPVATAVPATPEAPEPRTYTVRAGDTLSGIAATFGTTVQAIAELNGIDDPRRLRIGQELQLPPTE